MFKKTTLVLVLLLLLLLVACQTDEPDETNPTDPIDTIVPSDPTESVVIENPKIGDVIGLEDITVSKNEYFNPLKNVMITNQDDENITHLVSVSGSVHYGVVGTYQLTYSLSYGDDVFIHDRSVTVDNSPIVRTAATRNNLNTTQIGAGSGSYRVGPASSIQHPVNPQLINPDLLNTAVPSNGWWTSLLAANYGGSNGIYTNPLRSSFSNKGVEITNSGAGFVQYWNPDGYNTMANFSLVLPDIFMKSSDLNLGYTTHVIDYSETTVKVAMRNSGQPQDHMVVSYAQGSPYVFAEVANSNAASLVLGDLGVANYEYFDVDGNKLTGPSYTGNGIVIKFVQKHIGYETFRPAQVGQPIFGDRYFLLSTPEETRFNFSTSNHPQNLINKVSLLLGSENFFSVAAIQTLDEASYYHEHAYMKTLHGDVSYEVDMETSIVETTYHITTQNLKPELTTQPLQFLLPHHYQASTQELTNYTFQTVRGTLKLMEGRTFKTELSFHGMLPAMTLPTNDAFSPSYLSLYLSDLDNRTEIDDEDNFLNDHGPYWNGKALYPLAQGLIMADQMGDEDLKLSFIAKLRYLLSDWYTYSSPSDERYLYYNEAWGTVYYSNNDFNTATELSDHSFTHGYLIYASSVLAMYDDTFVTEFGDMVQLLLNDFMYPHKDAYEFDHLRSFDQWQGHTWAHGFGTFAEGNNIESSSEAINSWLGGYLWALQTNNTDLRDAAIYGFVHELNSAKTYMFDYDEIIFPKKYSDYASVAGMIWGGKYDYATWFGANPTFIYGIQWLPNGEYLSSYALNDFEKGRLSEIYADYLKAKNGTIDTWYANMWSIQALINPTLALSQFDAQKILNDDYPSDLSQTYYLLHGLMTFGSRDTSYTMVVHDRVSSSIYVDGNGLVNALIWNPSELEQSVTFRNPTGDLIVRLVPARSFTTVTLS